ncbi:MAG TPA: amidohydrolase family protein [Cytophagales bacterium]|nr:amidohydrolase family protein [Cytophagales bacterium]
MLKYFVLLMFVAAGAGITSNEQQKVFDVHLHGSSNPSEQLDELQKAGVYKIAVSTSWDLQQRYNNSDSLKVLSGLMVPCPNGKVPYSLQTCFSNNQEWPAIEWVEEQIIKKRIHFIGEVLSQYHGVSSSDSLLFPYYHLAEKYQLPVGIHTGSAGPDHGCPNFSEEMGNPKLMNELMIRFPKMKVWIMHSGVPYLLETIEMMKKYPGLYTDISAINNPHILQPAEFSKVMKQLIENGLEDRIMFGSDNGKIDVMINSINNLDYLTKKQKDKIFYKNAETFFRYW